jgi:HNH endonuclease
MRKALERQIRTRARHRCEYCLLPEQFSKLAFAIDHVIARQHGGLETVVNLALACGFCNRHKGPNVAGIDPVTKQIVRIFDPRREQWLEHFQWSGAEVIGLTAIGRCTVFVLSINHPLQIAMRRALMDEGVFFSE